VTFEKKERSTMLNEQRGFEDRRGRGNAVGAATRLQARRSTTRSSIPGRRNKFDSPSKRADWLCGPPSLLVAGYRDFFLWGKSAGA
jgi:hypothetical protein